MPRKFLGIRIMNRHRVQAIIIQDKKVLFGYGCIDLKNKVFKHFFIGGGVEKGESQEDAIMREIREETKVTGNVIFKFNNEALKLHTTFLVDIGNQKPQLGFDPEETNITANIKALQRLIFIPIDDSTEFTNIDIAHFGALLNECNIRGYYPEWYTGLSKLVVSI